MKEHTTIGAKTLDAALAAVPGHRFSGNGPGHRPDPPRAGGTGTGYPQKLTAGEIPLCGRIMALADVYDALTSKRVYKAAYGHELARSIIITGSGKQFDPDVVEAFVQTEPSFIILHDKLSETGLAAA